MCNSLVEMEVSVGSGVQINTTRFNCLWDAVKAAFFAKDYRRSRRILRIIGKYGRPDYEGFLAKDFGRYLREVRAADGKEPPAIRMSSEQLDELAGDDVEPEKLFLEREAASLYYRNKRTEIMAQIAKGDVASAREELERWAWSFKAYLPEQRWGVRKLRQIMILLRTQKNPWKFFW